MTFSLVESVVGAVTTVMQTIGLPGLFALMVVACIGIPPLPSEVILPFSGFLIAEGAYAFGPAVLVALLGGVVGAYIAYAIGRWGRERLTGLGIGRLRIAPSHLERMDDLFARRGEIMVGVTRLIPVIRVYVSYPAGTARMDPTRFGLYTAAGMAPYTIGFVYAGIVLNSNWDVIAREFAILNYVLIAGIVAVAIYLVCVALGWIRPSWIEPPAPKTAPSAGATPEPPAHP